jgi:hypothetical protein
MPKRQTINIGDTIEVLTGEHAGKTGNVRVLGCHGDGDLAVRLDDPDNDLSRDLVRFHSHNVRVISTEEIDRAKRVLLNAGWTLTPPQP